MLVPLRLGKQIVTLAGLQNFPDDAAPQACIYRAANGQWVMETKDGVTCLANGDLVDIDGSAWRLVCGEPQPSTAIPAGTITCMHFHVSLDEEHVRLMLERGASTLDLGERVHHYLLLLLARQRVQHAAMGFDPHSQGWVDLDDLVGMVGLEKTHLNIQIFRLRKQFESAVSQGLIEQDFIERRRGSVRLGNVALEIRRGSRLEGCWHPGAVASALSTPGHRTSSDEAARIAVTAA